MYECFAVRLRNKNISPGRFTLAPMHGELSLHPTSPGNGPTFKSDAAHPFRTAGATGDDA